MLDHRSRGDGRQPALDYDTAKKILDAHAGTETETGFLSSLRPYSGLREQNFHEVVEAILVVLAHHPSEGPLDRDVVDCLWELSNTARRWGLEPGGMLRRNNLIAPEDLGRLQEWVETVEWLTRSFISGMEPYLAASHYAGYVVKHGADGASPLLVGLLAEELDHGDGQYDIETAAKALKQFGSRARSALPALRRAANRTYTYAAPVERVTAEIQAVVKQTIETIEASGAEKDS